MIHRPRNGLQLAGIAAVDNLAHRAAQEGEPVAQVLAAAADRQVRAQPQLLFGLQFLVERFGWAACVAGVGAAILLAADAGIKVLPSTLLVFGSPPLGTQFIAARPEAGLDWPVRLLVQQDDKGDVWAVYTDFGWIARRHGVSGESTKPFETAAGVIASITSAVKGN